MIDLTSQADLGQLAKAASALGERNDTIGGAARSLESSARVLARVQKCEVDGCQTPPFCGTRMCAEHLAKLRTP